MDKVWTETEIEMLGTTLQLLNSQTVPLNSLMYPEVDMNVFRPLFIQSINKATMYLGTLLGSTVQVIVYITSDYYLYIEREKENTQVDLQKLFDCKSAVPKNENAVVLKFLKRGLIYNSTDELLIRFQTEEYREKFMLEMQHVLDYIVS